jgi:fatty acid synthase
LFSVGASGKVCWRGNWVAFMDSLLQLKILREESRGLFVPTYIRKLTIDAKRHTAEVQDIDTNTKDVGELD